MERQLFLDDVASLPVQAQRQVVSDLMILRKLYQSAHVSASTRNPNPAEGANSRMNIAKVTRFSRARTLP